MVVVLIVIIILVVKLAVLVIEIYCCHTYITDGIEFYSLLIPEHRGSYNVAPLEQAELRA